MMRPTLFLTLILSLFGTVSASADEATQAQLAAKAGSILQRHCLQCHRGDGSASKSKFDVRDVQSMIDSGVVMPGDAESSMLWLLAHRGTMPPRSQPQLSRLIAADSQNVADWINSGAPKFPDVVARTPITLEATLKVIIEDLKKLPDERARSRQRYFTLVEAWNNPGVSDETLKLSRAALSKALNSLSWERDIVLPRALDEQQTVFAVDVEELGWSREHWLAIRGRYPYAIGFNNLQESTLKDLDEEILRLTEHREPLYRVRADWFIATAMQPALYHALLYDLLLPELKKRLVDKSQPANPKHMTAQDLEQFLQVDVIANIDRGEEKAMRCGFTSSGVSGQNRLIERHRTKYGAYWKSYDFQAGNRRAILSQFPLGPVYPGNESSKLAFEHDGGEVIFNLPNGLQAYLLIDGQDNRIDAGPIEVVSDALKTSGTPAIVNGLSCMSCHKQGMIDAPADEIRDFSRVFGKAREHVLRLYPTVDVFQAKVDADARQFQMSLEATISQFLKTGDDMHRELSEFPEPVSDVARNYLLEEMDLRTIAAELYEPSLDRLRGKIEGDDLLQQLGMGVLLRQDGRIKRAFWESTLGGTSVMQLTAFTLDYTTPQFKE
jgi:mono/diheme cytochrome c family protein